MMLCARCPENTEATFQVTWRQGSRSVSEYWCAECARIVQPSRFDSPVGEHTIEIRERRS